MRLRAWCASAKEPPRRFCSASIRARADAGALDVEASVGPRPVREGGPKGTRTARATALEPVIIDIEGSVAPTLVITHATPARALLAYMHNRPRVRVVVDETATTEAPRTLAGADAAVIEVRATVAGGYSETGAPAARRGRLAAAVALAFFSGARPRCPGTSDGAGRSASRSAGRRVSSSPGCFCCQAQSRVAVNGISRPRLRHRRGFGSPSRPGVGA